MSIIPTGTTEIVPKPWQNGLAPVYIGMFLWVAFFDQIGRRALPVGGLGWSMLGAAVAGPLCYLLLFRGPATWGHRTGQPLVALSSSTFGVQGASLVPGLLLGIGQIILFAVAISFAVDLTFQGLVVGRWIDPRSLRPTLLGGASLKAPLYLATALVWAVATALVGLVFVRWIAFLMQFFPIFPAVMLGGVMLAMLTGLRSFQPTGIDPLASTIIVPEGERGLRAFLLTLQWVFGFSAMAGVVGADWGSGSVSLRDIRIGGWVGMAIAPAIVAALALIAAAGYQGSREAPRPFDQSALSRSTIEDLAAPGGSPTGAGTGLDVAPDTFRAALNGGFDRWIGCVMLLTFGLASLAPAVYSSSVFGQQFHTLGPGISRMTWTMMGTSAAWMLIVGGWFDRTEVAFNVLGAAFAPVAGALVADYRRQKGRWLGPRRAVNPAGLLAWAVGFAVGIVPTVARSVGSSRLANLQPAAVGAFVAAFLAYELFALCKLESARVQKLEADVSI